MPHTAFLRSWEKEWGSCTDPFIFHNAKEIQPDTLLSTNINFEQDIHFHSIDTSFPISASCWHYGGYYFAAEYVPGKNVGGKMNTFVDVLWTYFETNRYLNLASEFSHQIKIYIYMYILRTITIFLLFDDFDVYMCTIDVLEDSWFLG